MFTKLLRFEVFYQLKQRAFPIFLVLFLVLGVFAGSQGFAPTGVNFNSNYQVYFYTSLFTLGSVFIIMFFTISAMLRDKQHNMEGLVYTTPIKKNYFYWSRFLGAFIFGVLAFSPFIIGYAISVSFSNLDPERVGVFHFMTYFQPWLYIVIPNVFICTTLIFSVSTLTKNSIATYVSAVFIYMLYFVSSIFLNSPLLAQSVPASPESMAFASLADPFGIAAFFEQTQYWTASQKNTNFISFSGLFMWNRLLWCFASIGVLGGTYALFSFRKLSKKVKKSKKEKKEIIARHVYRPIEVVHNFKAQYVAFISLLKMELRSVFKSLPFIAVMAMWLFIVFSEMQSTVASGEYNDRLYPFTNILMELMVDPLTIFSLILIIFYSAEIVWKERELNFSIISDATPVKNWTFFVSKFIALLLLPILLIVSGIGIAISFQVYLGYTNFELGLYASIFYHYGLQLAIYSMIALFVNSLAKNKYMGMGLFGFIVIISLKASMLGLEHPLTSIGFLPRVSYSNMDGFSGITKLYNHLALYWSAFGGILVLLSFKLWQRGIVSGFMAQLRVLKNNWNRLQIVALSLLFIMFIGSTGVVFYNNNILSEYETTSDNLDFRENYERNFKKYDELERLYPTSLKTEVAIFPEEKKYSVKAKYVLKNKSKKMVNRIFLTERIPLEKIEIENAKLVKHDSIFGTYLFEFKKGLHPNETVGYEFVLNKEVKGYEVDNSIVKNGTYINQRDFEPFIGYRKGIEIRNNFEREKRDLPKRIEEIETAAHITLEDTKHERIDFETIISTKKNQTALSTGNLEKKWEKGNRSYYHYKATTKVMPMLAYFSANYKTKQTTFKGISIEQYFDENHDFNVDVIEKSTKETLNYCIANFGKYSLDHIRIAELPSHWSFGGYAHPGMISMVEDRLYLADLRDASSFNITAKRTIHEVAHQWWGHILTPKVVAGGALFVEGLAKYTEAVVMEKMYGKGVLYELSDAARRRYFSGRSFSGAMELPVYIDSGQGYISYGKAYTVFMALKDLIGEERLNQVLKVIVERHRYSDKIEANSIELLEELYKVTPSEHHMLIDDWLQRVITYDLSIRDSSYKQLANGMYEVTVKIEAKRLETLKDGIIEEISIKEPITIGMFTEHPSEVTNNDTIVHLKPHQIEGKETNLKIRVKEIPSYIAIDPYGTRSDENLSDNVVYLKK